MRKLRSCSTTPFSTGVSKCPPDFENMKGAILVHPGTKLPADLTADKLEELVHASGNDRVYGIVRFTEYAKNGGEVQTAANGYDGEEPTGVSARKDTFTLNKFYPELMASLTRNYNKQWDVYFFDDAGMLYGLKDDTEVLAGYPMTSVYGDATPYNTSSAKATMTVTFAHENAKRAFTDFDYVQLDFKPQNLTLGLTPVMLGKQASGNGYKLYESIGGNDVTAIYGPLIAAAGNTVLSGATSATSYDEATNTLTIASTAGADVSLKSPAVLFENDIKGIEQVSA